MAVGEDRLVDAGYGLDVAIRREAQHGTIRSAQLEVRDLVCRDDGTKRLEGRARDRIGPRTGGGGAQEAQDAPKVRAAHPTHRRKIRVSAYDNKRTPAGVL